jgi:hypothetical protein
MINTLSTRARDAWYRVCITISGAAKAKRLRLIIEWLARVFGYGYALNRSKWDVPLNETKGDNRLGEEFLARLERR